MHELSIALEILEMLEKNNYLKDIKIVKTINLTIGNYSGIDKNYLEFAFQNLGDNRFKTVIIECNYNETDDIKVNEIIAD
ncbi:MAG: hydrogenase/urease maturation nickel metallochaperone HypA [bacterium]